ncbi:MAG TPA: tyrosine--tRNA ligase [Devosiaceae bacterium]
MSQFRSDFLRVLEERGFIHQISDPEGLDQACSSGMVTAYVGYDATAPSLHIGNLLSIMMLHWFQQTGHRPIALMGGGTTMVGDPSGKDAQRKLLTPDAIANNIAGIRQTFAKFLRFGDTGNDALIANNADWLLDLKYVDFLREIGRHFSINRMLTFDSVKLRLEREQPLSFLEFNYMILQAYDFVELNKRFDCRLQMGGSDQWGNIVNGIDLGRRVNEAELFALTCPLLTTSSGAKMGKSVDGAIWLDAALKSPYDYWQYWRNTEDADVERFLKLYTVLPLDEIGRVVAGDINEAKKRLATEATALAHGPEAAAEAAETARATFETGALDLSLPTVEIARTELNSGLGVLAACVTTGLAASNGEARRHVKSGAVRINDRLVEDDRLSVDASHLLPEGVIKISVGKKKHALIRPI